ncbi:MAG: hypothetical protein IJZ85_01645 [Lachnospiraceae bacterium]|nr:hypothetical protein [Lachnospiraceae bacterium]
MKALKVIANIFGVLIALVLSLILTVFLIASPVISAATSFMQSDTLRKVVKNIDYTEMVMANEELAASLSESGIDGAMLESLLDTEMVEEILTVYVDSVFAVLEGEADRITLTEETINKIIQEHIDELLPIVKAYIGDQYPITDEMLKPMVSEMMEDYAGDIVLMLPDADDLGLDAEMIELISLTRNGTVLIGVVAVAAVLSLLILLCRFVRFKGFMWLGVEYLLSAAVTLLAAFGMGSATKAMLVSAAPGSEVIAEPILAVVSAELLKGGGVLAGLAVLFILIFALGRVMLKKRRERLESETVYQEETLNEWV